MLDEAHPPRDFHSVIKPAIEDMMGREVTFDILFHNSEHQATLFRYGVKKSFQVSRTRKHRLRSQTRQTRVCLYVSDREDLQAHHANLAEAVRGEEAVKPLCVVPMLATRGSLCCPLFFLNSCYPISAYVFFMFPDIALKNFCFFPT